MAQCTLFVGNCGVHKSCPCRISWEKLAGSSMTTNSMIKLRWVSIDLRGPQLSESTEAPAWQVSKSIHGRFEFCNLCRDILSAITWIQGKCSGPRSKWLEPLPALFMFTMSYRPATFLKRGLWPIPHQQLKTASSIPAILKGPEGLQCMGGWDDEYLIPTTERSTDS